MIFIKPNGTNESFAEAFEPLIKMTELEGVEGITGNLEFPSWEEYTKAFLQDPNVATNVIDTSRLLTSVVLKEKAEELADLTSEFPEFDAGFNFSESSLKSNSASFIETLLTICEPQLEK